MQQLVTDRTKADIINNTKKGNYTPEDMNRVESAVQEIQELAKQLDIHTKLTTKTNWKMPGIYSPESWVTRDQMHRYLSNYTTLCSTILERTVAVRGDRLDWKGANQIEADLEEAYKAIMKKISLYRHSGEIYAGGSGL